MPSDDSAGVCPQARELLAGRGVADRVEVSIAIWIFGATLVLYWVPERMVVLSLPHIVLLHDARLARVYATRTDAPITEAADIHATARAVERVLDALGRAQLDILIDLRKAPLRVETDFETPMAALRLALTRGVRRAAFFVQTGVGLLQVRRFLHDQGIDAGVFDSEAAAISHLVSAPR